MLGSISGELPYIDVYIAGVMFIHYHFKKWNCGAEKHGWALPLVPKDKLEGCQGFLLQQLQYQGLGLIKQLYLDSTSGEQVLEFLIAGFVRLQGSAKGPLIPKFTM
jgi:hypothetical protein